MGRGIRQYLDYLELLGKNTYFNHLELLRLLRLLRLFVKYIISYLYAFFELLWSTMVTQTLLITMILQIWTKLGMIQFAMKTFRTLLLLHKRLLLRKLLLLYWSFLIFFTYLPVMICDFCFSIHLRIPVHVPSELAGGESRSKILRARTAKIFRSVSEILHSQQVEP